jgi:hypothetical protein
MGVIVGLEGGGTKTGCAVLTEQGERFAYAEGGPANLNFVDEATQRQSFEDALNSALRGIDAPVLSTRLLRGRYTRQLGLGTPAAGQPACLSDRRGADGDA